MASPSPFPYKPLRKPTNIRLIWIEPEAAGAPISISLFEALHTKSRKPRLLVTVSNRFQRLRNDDVPEHQDYFALSYVWGNSTDRISITVDGVGFEVTRNLHDFLIQMRDEKERRGPYWIDAICINQKDDVEKGKQVSMMGDVYRQTHCCILWLGQEGDDSHLAFELFRDVEEKWRSFYEALHKEEPLKYLKNEWALMTALDDTYALNRFASMKLWGLDMPDPFKHQAWWAVNKMFERPWFMRIWTIQEFVLPKNTKIISGGDEIKAETLVTFIRTINSVTGIQGAPPYYEADGYGACDAKCVARYGSQHFGRDLDLLRSSLQHRRTQATDPRDKIFGLLGLITTGRGVKFEADYSKPTYEVYRGIAEYFIHNGHLSKILYATGQPRTVLELPSWVPDWNAPSHVDREFVPYLYEGAGRGAYAFHSWRLPPTSFALYCDGVALDTVEKILPIDFRRVTMGFEKTLQGYAMKSSKDCVLEESLLANTDIGIDGQKFFPASQSTLDILARTVTADTIYINDRYLRASPNESYLTQTPLHPNTFRLYDYGRVVCTTRDGYMVLAPQHVEIGDVVVALIALRMPFILRPTGTCYEMVGPCYVHGIMDREIYAEVEAGKRDTQEFEIR